MIKVEATEADFRLDSYNFDLPAGLVAQTPSRERGADSLYVLDRARPDAADDRIVPFASLPELLPPHSLLVANNSRVAPARIITRRPGGGALEALLLSPPPLLESAAVSCGPEMRSRGRALLRPARKIKIGERYELAPGLAMLVVAKLDFGQAEIELFWRGSLGERLAGAGQLPLPPYIRRSPSAEDADRYQTVYADRGKAGSLAAPTAGLHFTARIKDELLRAGHSWAELTLFVGYGTFSPVRVADIRAHQMHAEYAALPEDTARQILEAKAGGRPVIAVGTTSARVLEGVAAELAASGEDPLLAGREAPVDCFIYPGRPVRVIDGLITNFHLPESTLLMLVSAVTGRERMLAAYARAMDAGLRFFSYGDAMLIK